MGGYRPKNGITEVENYSKRFTDRFTFHSIPYLLNVFLYLFSYQIHLFLIYFNKVLFFIVFKPKTITSKSRIHMKMQMKYFLSSRFTVS